MEIWVYGWTTRIVFLLVVWLTRLVALLHLVRLEVDAREEGTCAPDVASLPVGLWLEVDARTDNVLGYVEFLNRIGRLGFQANLERAEAVEDYSVAITHVASHYVDEFTQNCVDIRLLCRGVFLNLLRDRLEVGNITDNGTCIELAFSLTLCANVLVNLKFY